MIEGDRGGTVGHEEKIDPEVFDGDARAPKLRRAFESWI